ncbi:MAG: carboxypeptidase-like regulatory domain-containing protein [Planctomycetota bacterium]|jgi:hypothetical protein
MSRVSVRKAPFLLLLILPALGLAELQAQMTITGTVTDEAGMPVANAQVLIQRLTLATTSGEDGTYQLFVPAARMAGQTSVQLTARRIGLRAQTVTVALVAGGASVRRSARRSIRFAPRTLPSPRPRRT